MLTFQTSGKSESTDATTAAWHPLILEYCQTLGADADAVDRLFHRIIVGELTDERAVESNAEEAFAELDIAIKCAHEQWLRGESVIRKMPKNFTPLSVATAPPADPNATTTQTNPVKPQPVLSITTKPADFDPRMQKAWDQVFDDDRIRRVAMHAKTLAEAIRRHAPIRGQAAPFLVFLAEPDAGTELTVAAYNLRIALDETNLIATYHFPQPFHIEGIGGRGPNPITTAMFRIWYAFHPALRDWDETRPVNCDEVDPSHFDALETSAKVILESLALKPDARDESGLTTSVGDPPGKAKPVDDGAAQAAQYAALLVSVKSLAESRFTGKHHRAVQLLVEAGGRKRIADVATDAGVGWDKPYKTGVDGFKKLITLKIKSLGAAIQVVDQQLRIVLADDVPKPRRRTTKISAWKAHPPEKAAPPTRRQ
jgi:hypothetical protein